MANRKFLIDSILGLAQKLGANPNKFMGTKSNINFLGTGDKGMKGTTFSGQLNEDFLDLGFGKNDMIKIIEQDAGYVTAGKLNDVQSQFFEPKSPEALYNIENDPHEINNLSNSENHKEILLLMRGDLQERIKEMPDLSFYPEPYLLDNAIKNPTAFGKDNKTAIAELIAIADLNLEPYDFVEGKIKLALKDKNPWKRYWGLIVCSSFGIQAKGLVPQIQKILQTDEINLVRNRAAEYLMLNKISFDQKKLKPLLENSSSETEANLILNTICLIKEYQPEIKFNFSKEIFPREWHDEPNDLVNRRLEYLMN